MKRLPVLCLLLALLLPLAACVSSPNESTLLLYKPAEPRTHTVEDKLDPSAVALPLNDAVTLTALWPTQHSEVKDAGEITFLAEASRRTNIRW